MPIPKTLRERLASAWQAFQVKTKADPKAIERHLAFCKARRETALGKMTPEGQQRFKALIAGDCKEIEAFADEVIRLGDLDRLEVMVAACHANPMLVTEKALQNVTKSFFKMLDLLNERSATEPPRE